MEEDFFRRGIIEREVKRFKRFTPQKMIKARNPKVVVIVGGAPLSRETASLYGADGYADSAATAVQELAAPKANDYVAAAADN
jgi:hypothetical protein